MVKRGINEINVYVRKRLLGDRLGLIDKNVQDIVVKGVWTEIYTWVTSVVWGQITGVCQMWSRADNEEVEEVGHKRDLIGCNIQGLKRVSLKKLETHIDRSAIEEVWVVGDEIRDRVWNRVSVQIRKKNG